MSSLLKKNANPIGKRAENNGHHGSYRIILPHTLIQTVDIEVRVASDITQFKVKQIENRPQLTHHTSRNSCSPAFDFVSTLLVSTRNRLV